MFLIRTPLCVCEYELDSVRFSVQKALRPAWMHGRVHTVCVCLCVCRCCSKERESLRNRARWWTAVWAKATFWMWGSRYLFGCQSTGLCLCCDNTVPAHKIGLVSSKKFFNQPDGLSEQRLWELKWRNSGQIMRLTSVTRRMWFPWAQKRTLAVLIARQRGKISIVVAYFAKNLLNTVPSQFCT